ncbi:MAG: anthranilate phosphoribosyltransferase [Pirellulaceae bacterium]|nr:anthranilate phosphoribosyltransferase [Pirellulaceae bacterium]
MTTPIAQALEKLASQAAIPRPLMEDVIDSMLSGRASEADMHGFLVTLQEKGETAEDLVGAASAMRRAMVKIHSDFPVVLDTCGTGGDGSQTFNISTAAAIVIAAAGVPVAKHGNRKITSSTGSADVLAELGINLDATPDVIQRCLVELKLCFCFAPRFHPAMKHVAEVRKRITGPTIFNRLGPLCNPASANRQVLGVGSETLQTKLADALQQLGTDHSIVVRGQDGVDEVSLEYPTMALEVTGGPIQTIVWQPQDFGLQPQNRAGIFADSPASSAACIRESLSGRPGPCRDAVLINAAAGLWLAGLSADLRVCCQLAAEAIDTGAASDLIKRLGRLTAS